MRCYTIEEYDERRIQIIEELKNYKKEMEIMDIASDIFMTKYNDVMKMLDCDHTLVESKWNYNHWALWVRSDQNVLTCSNHSEGFQSRSDDDNSSRSNLITRISNLMKKTIKHALNYFPDHGILLRDKENKRRDFVFEKLKESNTIHLSSIKHCSYFTYLLILNLTNEEEKDDERRRKIMFEEKEENSWKRKEKQY